MNEFFAILDTETNKLVTASEAVNAGSDPSSDAVAYKHHDSLFSEDDSELAYIIHEANKVNDWKVIPVNVSIQVNITRR
jgi:hypothetical protein